MEENKIFKAKKLILHKTSNEGLREGTMKNGRKYSVREHRLTYFMPDIWIKFVDALNSKRAKLTAEILIQTGARINEVRNIEERDIDYERNTIRLRITKTKAKKGELVGKPRTIPINSQFVKQLKKHFKELPSGSKIGLLSTPAFNIAMKKALKEIKYPEWYMLSAHNIRKTHGNWLKLLGNSRMIECDAMEICLRLGHDYNTFLRDYGSSGSSNPQDLVAIKSLFGDLYERQW
jgi:integrase